MMKLVIIEGATSTGKSTLARKLARDLKMKVFLKDDYKEREFDMIGDKLDIKQMKRIEKQSWQEIFKAVKVAVDTDKALIIEANFYRSHRRDIKRLLQPNVIVIEIFCYARGRTILKRYIQRNRSGERHAGHHDHWWYPLVTLEALVTGIEKRIRPLRLSPHLLEVNTDNFASIDYKAIRQFIVTAD